jgi:hypothetical protein
VGFGENLNGCERNLLKEVDFVSELWISEKVWNFFPDVV